MGATGAGNAAIAWILPQPDWFATLQRFSFKHKRFDHWVILICRFRVGPEVNLNNRFLEV